MSELKRFKDSVALADALAERVCHALVSGINKRGKAILAVSGGSTPKVFFKALGTRSINWEKVVVTLVDERWVEADDERSNARLVRENLLTNKASKADFFPLYRAGNIDQAISHLEKDLARLPLPFDAVILGMGVDGHTASFFPGGDNLDAAVDRNGKNLVSTMRAGGAGEPRVTFTLPVLVESGFLALHIEGADKLDVLKKASGDGDANAMPVRHILRAAEKLEVYWAP